MSCYEDTVKSRTKRTIYSGPDGKQSKIRCESSHKSFCNLLAAFLLALLFTVVFYIAGLVLLGHIFLSLACAFFIFMVVTSKERNDYYEQFCQRCGGDFKNGDKVTTEFIIADPKYTSTGAAFHFHTPCFCLGKKK